MQSVDLDILGVGEQIRPNSLWTYIFKLSYSDTCNILCWFKVSSVQDLFYLRFKKYKVSYHLAILN